MKEKATLIIKNIDQIYTMDKRMPVYKHAFIAIHHDHIIAIGKGSFCSLLDKDTRVVEGNACIAVPAFIECCGASIPSSETFDHDRSLHEYLMRYMRHGTLTIHLCKEDCIHSNVMNYHYDVLQNKLRNHELMLTKDNLKKTIVALCGNGCITCKGQSFQLQNQLLLAQLYAFQHELSSLYLLQALTINPANMLQLSNIGMLKVGMQADVLLFHASSLDEIFQGFHDDLLVQIIKKGVRIHPNLLI